MVMNQVEHWLESHGVSSTEAKDITAHFMKNFRATVAPDYKTDEAGLDRFRKNLWAQVLPQKFLALLDGLYPLWKKTRLHELVAESYITDLLDELGNDYTLALITNGPSIAQWEKINGTGVIDYFDLIIVSGDIEVEKPNKLIFDKAFSKLKVKASECIMVGDTLATDIMGGYNAGVAATVWINLFNKTDVQFTIRPDYTLSDVTEIHTVLDKLAISNV